MKRYLKSIYKAMGANAYLKHSVTVAEVADSIRQVRSGIAQCSPDVTAMLFERVASLSSAAKINDYQNHPFTRREFEVLNLIAKGYSNKDIADYLVVEVRTIKHHVHNILQKLTVQNRLEATRIAEQHGWLNCYDTQLTSVEM